MAKPEVLKDSDGRLWEVLERSNGNIELRSQEYPDNTNLYKRAFLESVIDAGIFTRIEPGEEGNHDH